MKKDCADMTPLELAKWKVRDEVLRGDTVAEIMARQGGSGGPGYHVEIGGWIHSAEWHALMANDPIDYNKVHAPAHQGVRIPYSKIHVQKAQGKLVNHIFPLVDICRLIKEEQEQPALL